MIVQKAVPSTKKTVPFSSQTPSIIPEQGEILAVRLGCVRNRDQWAMALGDKIVCRLLAWRPLYRLVPASSSLKHCWIYMKLLLDAIDYNVWKQFDKLGCDRIYEVTKIFGIINGNILSSKIFSFTFSKYLALMFKNN